MLIFSARHSATTKTMSWRGLVKEVQTNVVSLWVDAVLSLNLGSASALDCADRHESWNGYEEKRGICKACQWLATMLKVRSRGEVTYPIELKNDMIELSQQCTRIG